MATVGVKGIFCVSYLQIEPTLWTGKEWLSNIRLSWVGSDLTQVVDGVYIQSLWW